MDLRSNAPQQNSNRDIGTKIQVDFPKLKLSNSNRNNDPRENSIDSQESDDGYDM